VVRVVDGDTVELTKLGSVRLIGVDTPEVYGGVECYGKAASAYTKRVLAPGTRVEYRLGVEERDRYGRALVYLWLADGTFFNEQLVRRGYATPLTIPPNVDFEERFRAAARDAREAGRGLWSDADCARSSEPPASGCARFKTHDEAQAWWERSGRPEGLDGDGDGAVCEDLP
jgi:micrococcal nuclease